MIWDTIWDMIYHIWCMIWYDMLYDIWYMIYDVWYDMMLYDMIRYDTVRYDTIYMIWYYIWYMIWYIYIYMIYFLTAIGLPPGGSSTVYIHTQTVHRTTQITNENKKIRKIIITVQRCGHYKLHGKFRMWMCN